MQAEDEAERLNEEGLAHWRADRQHEAVAAFEAASVAARRCNFAPADVASIDGNLAFAAHATGAYDIALAAQTRVLAFREAAFADRPAELIPALIELADISVRMNLGDEALSHARRLWRLVSRTRIDGQRVRDFPIAARAAATLGLALAAAGLRARAIGVLQRARREYERLPEHDGTVLHDVLDRLARLHAETGDTATSAATARDLVQLTKACLGPDHPNTVIALNLCGSRCHDDRRYEEAISFFQEALDLAPDADIAPADRANIAANLAKSFLQLDRLVPADEILCSAERLLAGHGLEHGASATGVIIARAQWLRRQRRFVDARAKITRAMTIYEAHHGPRSHHLATALNDLGGLALDEGQYAAAEAAYLQLTELEGLSDLRRATALHNLGNLRLDRGDLAGARAATESSLTLKRRYGEDHGRLAASLTNLGAIERDSGNRAAALTHLERALAMEERDYGPASQQSALTRANLVGVLAAEGRLDEAQAQLALVLQTQQARLDDLIRLNDDAQRIVLLGDMRHELDAYIGVSSVILQRSPERAADVYRELSRRKGLLTDALTEDARSRRRKRSAGDHGAAWSIGSDTIPLLPEGTVLLDFVGYGTAHLTLGPDAKVTLPTARRYGAFVLTSLDDVRFRDLGAAEVVEARVAHAMRMVHGAGDVEDTRTATRELRRIIWDPLKLDLNDFEHVVIAPDGVLNDVSFAALADDTPRGWLGDGLVFSYVNSVRDLTASAPMADEVASGPPLVVADPAYLADSGWGRLSGTRGEGETIAKRLGCALQAFTRATPACLRLAGSPRILHVAAHGFYLPYLPQPAASLPQHLIAIVGQADPLSRAGIALAPDRDEDGKVINDGIVSARAMLDLDLAHTELAVLSACETGLGHPEPLDGAHGLRRALRAAGVATVVASLWRVDDTTAPLLMERFYDHLESEPPFRALALASREIAATRATRHPCHWAAFIAFGHHGNRQSFAPHIVSGSGSGSVPRRASTDRA